MFKNALVSVSDKTGLAQFLRPLAKKGLRIVSTGGTADYLRSEGFEVVDVKDQTGFPEVMGGRVKTLHPRIHMPILARDFVPADLQLLQDQGLEAFDLVIVNLYPFEATLGAAQKQSLTEADLIEKIDIGGPTLIRASAKNFSRITVVVDPSDYERLLEPSEVTSAVRKQMAAKAFAHVSRYDSLISSWLGNEDEKEVSVTGRLVQKLRYGENPHQSGSWYATSSFSEGLHQAKILQGKELSYNNLLDLEAALLLVREMQDPCLVAVKHNNPCGVAIDSDFSVAVAKALAADPISVFGGVVAVNREVTVTEAQLLEKVFLECLIAPKISSEARDIFAKKKNLRILDWPGLMSPAAKKEVRSISGGFLIQNSQELSSDPSQWKFLGEVPDEKIIQDLQFAEKVCAILKSNAIAIVKDGQTLGLGMGQVNRVDAVHHATQRMRSFHPDIERAVLASDAFFPFPDSIENAAHSGIKWILQPGGSLRDEEVFQVARRLNLNMILTGERHFRH